MRILTNKQWNVLKKEGKKFDISLNITLNDYEEIHELLSTSRKASAYYLRQTIMEQMDKQI